MRAKSRCDEFVRQRTRLACPQRKQRAEARGANQPLAILSNIGKKQVAERDPPHFRIFASHASERLIERRFVCVVRRLLLERNLDQGQSSGSCLRLHQRAPDTMDAHTIVTACHARLECHHLITRVPAQRGQRETAILAAAPAQYKWLGDHLAGVAGGGAVDSCTCTSRHPSGRFCIIIVTASSPVVLWPFARVLRALILSVTTAASELSTVNSGSPT